MAAVHSEQRTQPCRHVLDYMQSATWASRCQLNCTWCWFSTVAQRWSYYGRVRTTGQDVLQCTLACHIHSYYVLPASLALHACCNSSIEHKRIGRIKGIKTAEELLCGCRKITITLFRPNLLTNMTFSGNYLASCTFSVSGDITAD